MKLNKVNKVAWLLLAVVLICFSCAGLQPGTQSDSAKTTAWKTLMSSKQAYDAAFNTLAALDKQGKLPADVKEQCIKYGNLYMQAHNAAVNLLLADKLPDLSTMTAALNDLLKTAAPYLGGK